MYKLLVKFLATLVIIIRVIVRVTKDSIVEYGPVVYNEYEMFIFIAMLNGYGTWILVFRVAQEFSRKLYKQL